MADKNDNNTELKYYDIEGLDTRNTFSKDIAEHYVKAGFAVKTNTVKLITLEKLIEEYGEKINYINIDIEGLEYDILKNFNFSKYQIEIFNIEKGDARVKTLMLLHNYELVSEILSNWIFIKKGLIEKES